MANRQRGALPVILLYAVLTSGCWIILSGRFNGLHLGLGLVSIVASLWLVRALQKTYGVSGAPKGFGFLFYPLWLEGQILTASLKTLRIILSRNEIIPAAVWAEYGDLTPAGIAVYTHSITLTPGTVSLYVDTNRKRIMVHALTASDADGITRGDMLHKIAPYFRERV